jgi:16S rRNA (cytidine1402-2'-O)-methyltransferase
MAADQLDELLLTSLERDSLKDAVAHAVELSGRPRREIYARALELSKRRDAEGQESEDSQAGQDNRDDDKG